MRHRNSGRQLSRNASHRHAMLRNMATSLLQHETIRTTMAKVDTIGLRRLAHSRLRDDAVVEKLFADLGPRFKARAGGYTRILKMEPRPGDNADMALMSLVESAAVAADKKDAKAPKKSKKADAADESTAAEKPKRKKKAAA